MFIYLILLGIMCAVLIYISVCALLYFVKPAGQVKLTVFLPQNPVLVTLTESEKNKRSIESLFSWSPQANNTVGQLYQTAYFTHQLSCKQKSQSETCLLNIKVSIMIFIIFLFELFGFLLYPLWLFCFLVLWLTVVSQEFIQVYETILVTINILREQTYITGLFYMQSA